MLEFVKLIMAIVKLPPIWKCRFCKEDLLRKSAVTRKNINYKYITKKLYVTKFIVHEQKYFESLSLVLVVTFVTQTLSLVTTSDMTRLTIQVMLINVTIKGYDYLIF